MGLFIAVSSQNGSISFSATSCRRTMPDVDFFMQCMRASFNELHEAASKTNRKTAKTGKTGKAGKKKIAKKALSKKKAPKKVAAKKTAAAKKSTDN